MKVNYETIIGRKKWAEAERKNVKSQSDVTEEKPSSRIGFEKDLKTLKKLGIIRATEGSNMWHIKRKKPYTEIGVRRLKCVRCGKQAEYQWQICADGNNYRPLCLDCDILLNETVLNFMGHPKAKELTFKYSEMMKKGEVE